MFTCVYYKLFCVKEKLTQINYNAMILAFAKCGSLQMSIRTLDEMLEKQMRVDSFTSPPPRTPPPSNARTLLLAFLSFYFCTYCM